jgi:osmotically-inducible protein OsmY
MKTSQIIKQYKAFLLLPLIIIFIGSTFYFSQIDPNQLAKNVKEHIANYYMEQFHVSADQNGIITISGEVNALYDKLRIEELIASTDGVKGLNNKIEIKNVITADDIIKANIENELQINDAILEPEKIKVDVKNEVVTLSGTVSYYREKLMTQTIASWQDGVNDIISNIVVLPPAIAKSDDNLKAIITDVINKDFSLEKNVWFEVSNGKVTLNGTVTSLYSRDNMPKEIQRILGVKSVKNDLRLENNY